MLRKSGNCYMRVYAQCTSSVSTNKVDHIPPPPDFFHIHIYTHYTIIHASARTLSISDFDKKFDTSRRAAKVSIMFQRYFNTNFVSSFYIAFLFRTVYTKQVTKAI